MGISKGILLFLIILVMGCNKNNGDINNKALRINNYEFNPICKNNGFVYLKKEITLKGVIDIQDNSNKFCFFLPDDYKLAGCKWDEIPILEIEKIYKKMDLKKNSLWIELKCKLKYINLEAETGDKLEDMLEKVGTINYDEVPFKKIEDAKIIRLYIGSKHEFKKMPSMVGRLKE